ncbi:MAG: hypothetical protein E7576_00075 [Ruminococcaceae bacterium]|jgi:hypothetical protein|nr:hypothetical protein [Oscillospiraceae bacterium]
MTKSSTLIRKIAAWTLAASLLLSGFTACGQKKSPEDEDAAEKTELLTGVYRGTVYPLPEGYSIDSSAAATYDPETDTVSCFATGYFENEDGDYEANSALFRLGPDGVKEEIPLDLGTDAYVSASCTVGDDMVFLAQSWDDSGTPENSLVRWTEGGCETTDRLERFFSQGAENGWFTINSLAADGDGNLYLGADQEIAVLKPDMTLLSNVFTSSWINGMETGADGTVYICSWFDEGTGIAPVDPVSHSIGKPILLPNGSEFFFGPDFDVYVSTNTALVGMTFGENGSESETLVDYVNSNLNPNEVRILGVIDRDTVLIAEQTDPENWTSSPAVYRHAEDVDLSQVTVIELAYGNQDLGYSLPQRIVAFNKAHPDMRIVVKDYTEYAASDDWEAGIRQLASDMVTGVYRPDIVAGSPDRQDLSALKAKKLYRDLIPFMEKDDVLTPDNLFGCVKSALTDPSDGTLWCMTSDFMLQTLLSTGKILGKYADRSGWTIGEFLDFASSLPADVELGEGMSQDSAAAYLGGSYGAFIDEEAGTCSFDGEDFLRWLEFLKTLPKDYMELGTVSALEQTPWEERYELYRAGKVALQSKGLHDLGDFLQLEMPFGTEDYRLIGYPAKEGESGTWLRADLALVMTNWCEHPDEAWEVISSFCDGSLESYHNGLPVLKTEFDKQAEEYLTYEFAFYYDGSSSWGTIDPDHPMTEDDLDRPGILKHFTKDDAVRIRSFLDQPAKLIADTVDDEVNAIVYEEISALTAGVSSPADCAKKIQSRVSIWLAEHK